MADTGQDHAPDTAVAPDPDHAMDPAVDHAVDPAPDHAMDPAVDHAVDPALAHDHRERRCPRLGSPVSFAYCRRHADGEGGLCWKALDCWWEDFDVAAYFRARLSPAAWERLAAARPPSKPASLVALIAAARQRLATDDDNNGPE